MPGNPITIRNLGPEDAHVLDRVREGTFDNPIDPSLAWGFLATRVNEIVVALDMGEVIGFVSGTVTMHPDKPTSFFVNELGVHAEYRRQGIAARLMRRIGELASDRGCDRLWFATEIDNAEARGFYRAINAVETERAIYYELPV